MFASVVSMFDDQFETEGAGYLFRLNRVGPAYRVTAHDRAEALKIYRRRLPIVFGSMLLAFLPIIAASVVLVRTYGPMGGIALLGLLIPMVILVPLHRWAWKGATAPLQRGFAAAPALDREEYQRQAMAELDWPTVAIIACAISIGPLFKMDHFPPQGWDWVLAAIAAFGPLFAGWLAIRKLRYRRR